ncbi:MAG: hypothetical protein FK734_07940 [Asgard group archaeon]|nr:hypothetical protein [Asgard group archaeon]
MGLYEGMKKQFLLIILLSILTLNSTMTLGNTNTENTLVLEEITHIESTGGDTFQTIAEGELLIVMDMIGGLRFYNITDPANPVYLSYFDDGGIPHEMFKVGNLLYLADHYEGLEIYNISNPASIVKLGAIEDDGYGEMDGVFVKDNIAYVAEWHDSISDWSMKVINVSDSSNPQEIVEYRDGSNQFIRFFVENEICYTSCLDEGFKILNVSDLNNINEIAHYDQLGYSFNFEKVDDRVFLSDASGLVVLDVSIIDSPVLASNYSTGSHGIFDVEIVDDLAFLANDENGLLVLNISNIENIVKITEYQTDDIIGVEIQDDLIFVSMHTYGLLILQMKWETIINSATIPYWILGVVIPIIVVLKRRNQKRNS